MALFENLSGSCDFIFSWSSPGGFGQSVTFLSYSLTPIGPGIPGPPSNYIGLLSTQAQNTSIGTWGYITPPLPGKSYTKTSAPPVYNTAPVYGANAVFQSKGLFHYFVPTFIPGATGTLTQGINERGDLTGSYYYNNNGNLNSFIDQRNLTSGLGGPDSITLIQSVCGITDSVANVSLGINFSDFLTGYYTDLSGVTHGWANTGYGCQAFLDAPNAKVTMLSAINDAEQILGFYSGPDGLDGGVNGLLIKIPGYNLVSATNIIYPGALRTFPGGINNPSDPYNLGQIIGYYNESQNPGIAHGFLLSGANIVTDVSGNISISGGTFSTIDFPGASNTFPSGINDLGEIVGYYNLATEPGVAHGYLQIGNNFFTIDMKNYVSTGAINTLLSGINNNGQIVGYYNNSQGNDDQGFLISNMVDAVDLQNDIADKNYSSLAVNGNAVTGVAADGVAEILIRIPVSSPGDTVSFSLGSGQTLNPDVEGGLFPVGGACCQATVNTQAQNTLSPTTPPYAFVMYRGPKDFVLPNDFFLSPNQASRDIQINVQINQNNPSELTVKIVRPPVVLIHGIWSSPRDSWSFFSPLYYYDTASSTFQSDPRYFIRTENYSSTSYLGFRTNAKPVLNDLRRFVNEFKVQRSVAAVQVDVVAHSMGGDITRTLTTLPNFITGANYYQGDIHKLITLDTPHDGSPFAANLFYSNANCHQFFASKGRIISTAVQDLMPNSLALQTINMRNANNPYPLQAHLIAGNASADQIVTVENSLVTKLFVLDSCPNLLSDSSNNYVGFNGLLGPSDLIVPVVSQLGGNPNISISGNMLPIDEFDIYNGYIHAADTRLFTAGPDILNEGVASFLNVPYAIISGNNQIPNAVINLLNTPVQSSKYGPILP